MLKAGRGVLEFSEMGGLVFEMGGGGVLTPLRTMNLCELFYLFTYYVTESVFVCSI